MTTFSSLAILPNRQLETAKPTGAQRHLIEVKAAYAGCIAIAGIFLNLYLFRLGGLGLLVSYQMALFGACIPAVAIGGRPMRTFGTRSLIRAGLALQCGLYLMLLAAGEHARAISTPLGILDGVGAGLYWSALNVTEYIVTRTGSRHLYLGRAVLFVSLAGMISPILGAGVIALTSTWLSLHDAYLVLFAIVMVFFALTARYAASLDTFQGLNFSASQALRTSRGGAWLMVMAQQFVGALWRDSLPILSGVLIFLILGHEVTVGLVGSLGAALSGLAGLCTGKVLHRHEWAYLLGATIVPIGIIGFVFGHSWIAVVFYLVFVRCFDGFSKNPLDKTFYDAIDSTGLAWQDTFGMAMDRQIVVNVARISGLAVCAIFLSSYGQRTAIHACLMIAACLPIVGGLLQWKVQRAFALSAP